MDDEEQVYFGFALVQGAERDLDLVKSKLEEIAAGAAVERFMKAGRTLCGSGSMRVVAYESVFGVTLYGIKSIVGTRYEADKPETVPTQLRFYISHVSLSRDTATDLEQYLHDQRGPTRAECGPIVGPKK